MALLVGPGVGELVEVGLLTMAVAEVHSSSMWPSWKEAMRAAMVDWMLLCHAFPISIVGGGGVQEEELEVEEKPPEGGGIARWSL